MTAQRSIVICGGAFAGLALALAQKIVAGGDRGHDGGHPAEVFLGEIDLVGLVGVLAAFDRGFDAADGEGEEGGQDDDQ